MGPIALFDKSFLQSLSTDEAVWFDYFFIPVVCPVFFIETLADLEKPARHGKTPEEEVAIIAAKTPELSGGPCYFHLELCIGNLLGQPVPMDGRIPMAGGRPVKVAGKVSTIIEVTPEADAFQRWKASHFLDVERRHARGWRAALEAVDLSGLQRAMNAMGVTPKTCKSLSDARHTAGHVVAALTKSTGRFALALEALGIPRDARTLITERWKSIGKPSLRAFAPYAEHVLTVEFFFRIAVGANLIAATRASNRADVAYLLYAPFCQAFVSWDRLHRVCAPHFLRADQTFVWGQQLKGSLKAINEHFLALPPEKRRGSIYQFADTLPAEVEGVAHDLYKRYTPSLLRKRNRIKPSAIPGDKVSELVKQIKSFESAPFSQEAMMTTLDRMDGLVVKRSVHATRGSWIQVADEHRGDPERSRD